MLGETIAIVAALLGAVTGLFSREALRDVDPISANAIRAGVASVFMWILAVITGTLRNAKTIDLTSVVFVIIACIVGMGIGDTLFFKGLTLLGVSRCFTISYTSPLLVVVMANLFFKRTILSRDPSRSNRHSLWRFLGCVSEGAWENCLEGYRYGDRGFSFVVYRNNPPYHRATRDRCDAG